MNEEKPVYYVEGGDGGYGFAFVAKSEEKAVEYAINDADMMIDKELVEVWQTTRECQPVLVEGKEYGDKITLREGLLKGIYSFAVGLSCEREDCDTKSEYIVEYNGKIMCDACREELKRKGD